MDREPAIPVGASTEPGLWKTLPVETKANAQYSDLALADVPQPREQRDSKPVVDLPEGVAEVLGSIPTADTSRPHALSRSSRSIRQSEERTREEVSPAEVRALFVASNQVHL